MSSLSDDFGHRIVSDAFDQALFTAMHEAKNASPRLKATIDEFILAGHDQEQASMIAFAVVGAECALASFFSNLELKNSFKIMLEDEVGVFHDLRDEVDGPVIAEFFQDGWLGMFSKYSQFVIPWQKP